MSPLRRGGGLTDQEVETVVGNLLLAGVCSAAVVVLLGGILLLAREGATTPEYHVFHGEPSELRSTREVLKYAATFHARGIVQLGILLLIATPIMRVALSMFAFAKQRDWMYVGFTLFVLALLLYSLFDA